MSETTPGTVDPNANLLSLVPAANLVAGGADPDEVARLKQLQSDLQKIGGFSGKMSQDDLVVVNPSGRVVEIAGDMVDEYLAKQGFRRASPEEEANYRKSIIRQTPEYLRRIEKKRLKQQEELLSQIEEEDDNADVTVSNEDLQRAPILNGQSTNAPLEAPKATTPNPATQTKAPESDAKTSTAKPRSRSAKAKK